MNLIATLIRTPTEFGGTMHNHDSQVKYMFDIHPDFEPDLRRVSDAIFTGLADVTGQFPEKERLYVNSLEEPLKELADNGMALFAVSFTFPTTLPNGMEIPHWRRTYYFMVFKDNYYQLMLDAESPLVHRFNPHCKAVVADIYRMSEERLPFNQWVVEAEVRRDFEGTVPWCPTCCREEALR